MAIKSEQEERYPDAPVSSIAIGTDFEKYCSGVFLKMGIQLTPCITKWAQFNIGEDLEGYEFKLDAKHTDYGHLSIEVAERAWNGGPWRASGIFRNDNTRQYVQGNKEIFWIMPKHILVEYAKSIGIVPNLCLLEVCPNLIKESFGTIRKFYLEYLIADLIGKRIEIK